MLPAAPIGVGDRVLAVRNGLEVVALGLSDRLLG
jgi:hypothetical protein